ncbi:MAG: erythromycin esterase family protein [Chloroflexi bacterium]|nr:MAG: erythromycin esterase family protein [Chloroflexota bacterium]
MPDTTHTVLINAIRETAHPLTGATTDYDPLMNLIGDARFVLLGEASHGTHEFYQARAEITKRLITEKGFVAVAVEADWPDAYRVNRYVRGLNDDPTARDALAGFKRFPIWMWRNTDVLDFIEWLRAHNTGLPPDARKTGFYGLDLYSLHASIEAVISYLEKVDPEAAKRARYRYSCFEHFGEDTQAYGYAAGFNLSKSCEDEVVAQLIELQQHTSDYAKRDGRVAEDEFFYAEQNARLAKDAEEYYRTMFSGRVSSWNLRDRHMTETLEALVAHLDREGGGTKVVVWAHNSHVGDARATSMGSEGELNIGQLVRERHGRETVLVGFSTYTGTVTAASDWGAPLERKRVRPALPGSYEALFHQVGLSNFLLPSPNDSQAANALRGPRLERAIGVIYLPRTERVSHYFHARLPEQFDAVLHFDETRAVEPLDRTTQWEVGETEIPETYPWAV